MKLNLKRSRILVVLLLFISSLNSAPAHAGQITHYGASVTWDDNSFYVPTGCSNYYFNYAQDSTINFSNVVITNKFGDNIGNSMLSGTSGRASMMICSGKDFSGTTLNLEVTKSYVTSDGSVSSTSAPITFLSRSGAKSSNSAGKSDGSDASLVAQVAALRAQVAKLTAKINRICANRPKPKGC